jgi:hypothetical protein
MLSMYLVSRGNSVLLEVTNIPSLLSKVSILGIALYKGPIGQGIISIVPR